MPPEKVMATHSSTLAWKIPWMEEPGRLQSMGSLRVQHDWATSLSLFIFMHRRRKWQPTPVCLPGESQGRETGGLASMGSHRVGHDWCDLAAAAARCPMPPFSEHCNPPALGSFQQRHQKLQKGDALAKHSDTMCCTVQLKWRHIGSFWNP